MNFCRHDTGLGKTWSHLRPGLNKSKITKVLLFPGCTGANLSQSTFVAAKKLLTHLGYKVLLPSTYLCCGTLRSHAGLGGATQAQTKTTLTKFCEANNIQTIVSFATGCKQDYMVDVQQFLLDHWSVTLPLPYSKEGPPLRVAVHSPCTQTNALKNSHLSFEILKKIPQLELIRFGENSCCGAAGSYMLEHAEISEQLIEQLLTPELLKNCDLIVTSNIGCQLQFQRFLKINKIDLIVCHPIELIYGFINDGDLKSLLKSS